MGREGGRELESWHPEAPFLLLPLRSGPDEVNEAPIPALGMQIRLQFFPRSGTAALRSKGWEGGTGGGNRVGTRRASKYPCPSSQS